MLTIFKLHISKWRLLLFAGDLVCYLISIFMGIYIYPQDVHVTLIILYNYKLILLGVGVVYFCVLYIADTYDHQEDFRQGTNLAKVFFSCLIGTIAVVLIFYVPLVHDVGRGSLVAQALTFSILLTSWRVVFSAFPLPERLRKRIMIIGAGKSGLRLLKAIRRRPKCGILPVCFVDDDRQKIGQVIEDLPVVGDSSRLPEIAREYQASLAVVAITHEKSSKLLNGLINVSWNNCQLMDMPTMFEFLTGKLPIGHISEDWLFQMSLNHSRLYYRRLKRLLDLLLATSVLVMGSPLLLLLALLIKIDSKGPVFFRQERLGQEGKPFTILKFRTMVTGAECCGPSWTENGDPRITRVGRLIRKLRLDELPQLINILRGEMSFIGPRPLVNSEFNGNIPFYNYRLLVKPGITGWAQVMYPDGLALDTTPEKVKFDLYYIKNMGFVLDLTILLKTLKIILFGRGL